MFGKKDDPLVGVITGIMNDSVRRNEAEKKVNETFGIQSRRALPHERVAEYDAALREAQTKVLKEEQLDELKGIKKDEKAKMDYIKKAINSKDVNRRKADAADLRSDEFLDDAGEPDYGKERGGRPTNRWNTNVDIAARARRKVANRTKGLKNALKEEDARDRAIRKSQEKEDEKGGYKTAKEWEKYWDEHDPAMARFSRNARKIAQKKGLKESSRAEREARRDDYKYKITGSDKDKEDKIKERITKTTGYKFKKKD